MMISIAIFIFQANADKAAEDSVESSIETRKRKRESIQKINFDAEASSPKKNKSPHKVKSPGKLKAVPHPMVQ